MNAIERCNARADQAQADLLKGLKFIELVQRDYFGEMEHILAELSGAPEKVDAMRDRLYRMRIEHKEAKARLHEVQKWRERLEWCHSHMGFGFVTSDLLKYGPYFMAHAVRDKDCDCGAPIPVDSKTCIACGKGVACSISTQP